MIAWHERSREVAALLNPAFCSTLLLQTVEEYGQPMPFALSFLVLPIVLHRGTRDSLPQSINTSMQVWLERNPEVKVGFAERVQALAPYTREAVSFCLLQDRLRVVPEVGTLELVPRTGRRRRPKRTEEVRQCLQRAGLLGRWFALSTPATTYTLLGIRP